MQRTLEIIDAQIAALTGEADKYEAQTSAQAPVLAAVHHFAAATLRDLRKRVVAIHDVSQHSPSQ
jgi:hypothetical protein